MKKKEINKLTIDQSIKEYEKMKKELFNIRFQKINGQIKNSSKINETKRNIARLKTLIVRKNA
jgi:large subunit ribosomal protein L29